MIERWESFAESRLAAAAEQLARDEQTPVSRFYELGAALAEAAPSADSTSVMVSTRPGAWVEVRVVISTDDDEFEHVAVLNATLAGESDSDGLVRVVDIEWLIEDAE